LKWTLPNQNTSVALDISYKEDITIEEGRRQRQWQMQRGTYYQDKNSIEMWQVPPTWPFLTVMVVKITRNKYHKRIGG